MSDGVDRDEPRVLEYRKQVKFVTVPFKCFVFTLFLIFLITLGFYVFALFRGEVSAGLQAATVATGFTWLILYLEYIFLLKPLATSKIQVFKDRLLIRRGKKEIEVPFGEIVKIKGAVRKSLGGWFKLVLKNGKAYRFTVVLERVDYIVDAVMAYNPKLMDQDKYRNLRTNLILADHGLARLYGFFGQKYRWITLAHSVFLPAGFVAFLISQQGQMMIIHKWWSFYLSSFFKVYVSILVLGTIALFVINVVVDKTIKLRLSENPSNKTRDTELESSVYRKVFPAYLLSLFGFFALVYQFDLNALSWTRVGGAVPFLNVNKGETLWLDKRFNCVRCAYPLRQGDKVLFKRRGFPVLGQLVGIPGDVVQVNAIGKDGRYIANTETQTVPDSKLAIRVKPDGSAVMLVNLDEVHGRAVTELSHFISPAK